MSITIQKNIYSIGPRFGELEKVEIFSEEFKSLDLWVVNITLWTCRLVFKIKILLNILVKMRSSASPRRSCVCVCCVVLGLVLGNRFLKRQVLENRVSQKPCFKIKELF